MSLKLYRLYLLTLLLLSFCFFRLFYCQVVLLSNVFPLTECLHNQSESSSIKWNKVKSNGIKVIRRNTKLFLLIKAKKLNYPHPDMLRVKLLFSITQQTSSTTAVPAVAHLQKSRARTKYNIMLHLLFSFSNREQIVT